MYRAKKDFSPKFEGFKTMLVLTDGVDTHFRDDRQLQQLAGGKDYVPLLQSTFDEKSDVVVNVIGFQVSPDEAKEADEFKKAIEGLPVPGKYFPAESVEQLTDLLKQSMVRRLRYLVDRDGVPPPGMPEEGLDISGEDTNPQWSPGLKEALYTGRVKLNRSVERQISLGRGDYLLLNMVPEGNGFVFERDLFGDPGVKSKVKAPWNIRSKPQNDWLLAFHQNRYTKESELEAMVTLEDLRNRIVPRGGRIQQSKPRIVWFSLTSPGGKQAGGQRLEYGP